MRYIMSILNKDEFCKSLIDTIESKTANNEVKWNYFTEEDFEYNEGVLLENYINYEVDIESSVFCEINYGKNSDKIIRVAIVLLKNKFDNLNKNVKILICDRINKENFVEVCNDIKYEKLNNLYELIEFKSVKEFNILEKWFLNKVE